MQKVKNYIPNFLYLCYVWEQEFWYVNRSKLSLKISSD